jgi:biopolymer transport protein ExbD
MAQLKKTQRRDVDIPSASLSDMAFLLLIFFIVTTVFVKERGLHVNLPRAESIDKIPRVHAVTVYVDRAGNISIDDFLIDIPMVELVMLRKMQEDHNMITCFRTDQGTQYGVMADIMNQMRRANALRVSFEAKQKGR